MGLLVGRVETKLDQRQVLGNLYYGGFHPTTLKRFALFGSFASLTPYTGQTFLIQRKVGVFTPPMDKAIFGLNDPTFYPVAVKPKINLGGGGKNFYKIENNYEYYKIKSKEIFWMEFLEGNHHSHDVVIVNGNIKYCVTFLGYSFEDGTFDYWKYVETPKKDLENITPWINTHLSKFTGILNIETIGGKPIEAQLRMGDIDKFGDVDLMESIMTLYENKEWALSKSLPDLYVFPLFGAPNIDYTIKDPEQLMQIAICWQIDDFKDDQNPPSAVRLLYFSIDDINKGKKLREDLSKKISPPVKQILHEL